MALFIVPFNRLILQRGFRQRIEELPSRLWFSLGFVKKKMLEAFEIPTVASFSTWCRCWLPFPICSCWVDADYEPTGLIKMAGCLKMELLLFLWGISCQGAALWKELQPFLCYQKMRNILELQQQVSSISLPLICVPHIYHMDEIAQGHLSIGILTICALKSRSMVPVKLVC